MVFSLCIYTFVRSHCEGSRTSARFHFTKERLRDLTQHHIDRSKIRSFVTQHDLIKIVLTGHPPNLTFHCVAVLKQKRSASDCLPARSLKTTSSTRANRISSVHVLFLLFFGCRKVRSWSWKVYSTSPGDWGDQSDCKCKMLPSGSTSQNHGCQRTPWENPGGWNNRMCSLNPIFPSD